LLIWANSLFAQTLAVIEPARRVSLSARSQVMVLQDTLTLTLQITHQGNDAASVQNHLKSVLDTALSTLQKDTSSGLMEARSGAFGVSPRYDRDGRITAWQGRAEWILEGTDTARISRSAGRVQGMQVSQIAFGVSTAQLQLAQAKAQTQAIALFRQRASEVAKGFAASGYVVDDVNIGYDDASLPPRSPMMLARAANDAANVPLEAGTTSVSVSVSGSVKLQ